MSGKAKDKYITERKPQGKGMLRTDPAAPCANTRGENQGVGKKWSERWIRDGRLKELVGSRQDWWRKHARYSQMKSLNSQGKVKVLQASIEEKKKS